MAKKNEEKLAHQPILPLLIGLSVPAIFSMMIQALYNVVDTIYVGRLSKEALSALSLAFPVQLVLIAIGVGTGIGASSLISRLLGRGNHPEARRAGEQVMLLSLLYGVIFGVIGFFFSRPIMHLFTEDLMLIDLSVQYVRIIMVGSVAMFIPMIGNNILRGQGDTLRPMISMLIGAITNIVLDPFLIFGIGFFPRLGIAGAAYATIFARFVSGLYILGIIFSDKNIIRPTFNRFRLDRELITKVYRVAFPAMMMQMLASFMVTGINRIIGQSSLEAVAAFGIYFRLQSFILMPVFGLNQGFMPIVGYNFGHDNPHRVKEAIGYGFAVAFTFTFLGFLLFRFLPGPLILLFNDDPKLYRIGVHLLRTIAWAYPLIGPAILGATIFQALGKGMPSLVLSCSRQILLLLPMAFFLYRFGGLNAIWWAFPLSEGIAFVANMTWLRFTLKKALG